MDKELYDAYLDKDKKRKAARQMSQSQMMEHKLREWLQLKKYREKKNLEAE